MKKNMNVIITLLVFDILFIVGVLYLGTNSINTTKSKSKNKNDNKEIINKNKEIDYDKEKYDINEIIKYEIQTHEYNRNKIGKYYINSKDELDSFYKLFSKDVKIDENYLYSNIIFVQIETVGSSGIKCKLNDVKIENRNISFVYDETVPEGAMTDDMASWYMIAIIPKNKLNNIDISEWKKPSTVSNKYER